MEKFCTNPAYPYNATIFTSFGEGRIIESNDEEFVVEIDGEDYTFGKEFFSQMAIAWTN